MKEPFAGGLAVTKTAEQVQALNDINFQSYLAGLGTSEFASFTEANITEIMEDVEKDKSSNFLDSYNYLTGVDNNVANTAYYIARTNDLSNLTNDVNIMTSNQLTEAQMNRQIAGRQGEINEWANSNKLDTLYFLQILFISLTFLSIAAFLKSNGTISSPLFVFLAYIVGALAILVLLFRWRYTNVARDGRYWHKARFPRVPGTTTIGNICPNSG